MTHGKIPSKVAGRYNLSRDKLDIEVNGSPQPMKLLVSIKGDELTLTENKMMLKLHRVDPSMVKPEISEEEQIRRYLQRRTDAATNASQMSR